MKIDRHKIINQALATLCQQIEALDEAPIVPPVHVRLALSILYSFAADGSHRRFLELWDVMTDPTLGQERDQARRYLRQSVARTNLYGVARACGVDMMTPGMDACIRRLWQEPG